MKLFVLCCLILYVYIDCQVSAECSGCLLADGTCVKEGDSRYELPNPIVSSTGYCIKRTCRDRHMKLDHEEEREPAPRDCDSTRKCVQCHCNGPRYTCIVPK